MVLEIAKGWIIGFISLGFVAAALALAMAQFNATLTAGTAASNITGFALAGTQNSTSYFGTAGTLVGVGLLVGAVGVILLYTGSVGGGRQA